MQLERGQWGRRWGVIATAALSGALALAASRTAQASCGGDPYGLLWSYPANGAMYVPLDADLFVNGQLNGLPELDGEPLPRIAAGVYDLGQLEPLTRYEVRWDGAAIVFTTGEGDVAPPLREPSSDVRLTRNPIDFARCPLVLPQGCFDTGQHTGVRFDTGPSLAWLLDVVSCSGSVRQMVWPAACGLPVVESEDPIVCASVRSTNGATLSESTSVFCSAPDVAPNTLPRNSGCQGAWPPESAVTLVADDDVAPGSVGVEPEVPPTQSVPSEAAAPSPSPAAGCTLIPAGARAGAGIGSLCGVCLAALIPWLRRRSDASRAHRSRPAVER